MVWKNSPPISCTYIETVAELSNEALLCNQLFQKHKMDNRAEALVIPDSPPLQISLVGLSREPYLKLTNAKPTASVDVLVNDFLGLAQGPAHRCHHAQRTLFRALEKVF